MATAEQIKNLIKAHYLRDDNKFKTIVLQIAAYEAKGNNLSSAAKKELSTPTVVRGSSSSQKYVK